MRVAVVFPGQGTQQPGMGVPVAGPSRVEDRRAGRSRARRTARSPAARRARRAARAHARGAARGPVHVARRVGGDEAATCTTSSRSPVTRSGQVTALIASGVIDLDDGVRFAARRAELTQAAADAHPGKHGRTARRDGRRRAGRVRRGTRRVLDRQRQRPGPDRHRGNTRRPRHSRSAAPRSSACGARCRSTSAARSTRR